MRITTKILAALLAVFGALFIGAALLLAFAVQPRFDELEAFVHARDHARVQFNIQQQAHEMETRVADYAVWDDMYRYVNGRYPTFVEENFDDTWLGDYDINFMSIVDAQGRIAWTRALFDAKPSLMARIASERALMYLGRVRETDKPVSGVVWIGERALMVAALRATNTAGEAPGKGWVIMGRLLSAESLANQVQLDVRVLSSPSADPGVHDRWGQTLSAGASSWVDHHMRKSLVALPALDGGSAGAVMAERARNIADLGARALTVAFVLFTLLALGALAVLWLILRRVVIRPIANLEKHLRAQSHAVSDLALIELGGAEDEIARLGGAYNDLAKRLADTSRREREAEKAAAAAAAADRMKSDFLANVSHEFRAPLDTVIGYGELVQEEMADRGDVAGGRDIGHVLSAARTLHDLVDEIHDLSRIEAGRLELQLEEFDVAKMLRDVFDSARHVAEEDDVKIVVEPLGALGTAFGDEFRLQQCLSNVATFAIAGAEGRDILFEARRTHVASGDYLCFTVKDAGATRTDAQLRRAFDPFTALDGANDLSAPGLGLAIARKLAVLMGGVLEATTHEKGGAVLSLTLPAQAPDAAQANAARSRAA